MPTLGITMGDPLGIGPEIILKALPKFRQQVSFKVFGDPDLLKDLPKKELIPVSTLEIRDSKSEANKAGLATIAYLNAAMTAWRQNEIQALVTAPISKTHVKAAGFAFPGHTEYLADQTNSKEVIMMMAAPKLKVSLVTIHEPLQKVPQLLTREKILHTIQITYTALKTQFGIPQPRLGVLGLNPHAGEQGLLGKEEIEIIAPAIQQATQLGFNCKGPLVPDSAFHEAYMGKWDALVCMYHDQGLIPFKMLYVNEGVNVTLGMPLIRTSPDHGTAFDIAGKGIANSQSMEAAIELAIKMTNQNS